jgi:hypothetical protein
VTAAAAVTQASPPPRRQFRLPAADEVFLDHLGLRWEALVQGAQRWIVVYGLPLPIGYVQRSVNVAIQIAPGYPPGVLEMAFFDPPISRADGRAIPQTQGEIPLDGKSWQQWSRHRTEANPWVDGEDSFGSHFIYMQSWLEGEPKR